MTYTLYIKTDSMNSFKAFTTGDFAHISEWIQYVSKTYPHASYYTTLNQEEAHNDHTTNLF